MAARLSESDDEGENVPTLHLLVQELKVARWQTLGIHLGMTEDEITEIEQDHPSTARRRTAMLDKWLKKEENPSWMTVIEALKKMSEVNLAKKIRKKYISPEHVEEMPAKPRSRLNLVQKLKKKVWFPAAWQQPPAASCVPVHEAQQTSTDKVHIVELHRSDAFSKQIQNLWNKYFRLVKEIKSGLKSANPPSSDIEVFSKVYMCDEVSTVEGLFDQLKPFYFFDYALIEKISECLLMQELSILNEYIREVEEFKKSTTVQQFMENIESVHNESPQTCTVTIQLVGSWLPKTISNLEKLLDELFHNKATLLTRLKVVRKCVLVTYLAQSSEAISFIEAARPKISFMMKVGVSVLQVGDTVVTSTQNETSDFSFESSLIRSVKDNDIDVLSFLLDIDTSPDATDDKGLSGLLWACYLGRTKAANLLLKANANPNLHGNNGETPLFMASQNGHSDIVSFLLNAKADPNHCRDDGLTPLFIASEKGHSDIVSFLLKANADPNCCSDDHLTPLFMASHNGHSDIVSFLLKASADPNHCRGDGLTPLFIASQNGNSDVVRILLSANANPNLHKDNGTSPLIMASKNGHLDVVTLLYILKASANPNHQNNEGVTPLMAACLNSHPRIAQLLLTNGADPDLRDSSNSTALAFAYHSGCLDSIKLLSILTFGTDPFSQTPDLDMINEGT